MRQIQIAEKKEAITNIEGGAAEISSDIVKIGRWKRRDTARVAIGKVQHAIAGDGKQWFRTDVHIRDQLILAKNTARLIRISNYRMHSRRRWNWIDQITLRVCVNRRICV